MIPNGGAYGLSNMDFHKVQGCQNQQCWFKPF